MFKYLDIVIESIINFLCIEKLIMDLPEYQLRNKLSIKIAKKHTNV